MSTPLATSLLNTGNAASPPGPGTDLTLNQSLDRSGSGFNAVFGEAVAATPALSAEVSPLEVDVEEALQQLQGLPQGGKLLPLLRQVLTTAESEGRDPRLLLQEFSENMAVSGQDPELTSAEAVFAALYPLEPSQAPLTAAHSGSAGVQGNALPGSGTARPDLLELVERQLGMGAEDGKAAKLLPGPEPDLKLSAPERMLSLAMDASTPRPAGFDQLMAGVLKRMTADGRLSAAADSPARVESPLSAAAAATATATGVAGQSPAASVATTGVPASLNITVPLDQANWDQALGERVQWMVGQRLQGAHIRLNPDNLGPMEIKLNIQNDQASVQFSSAHGVVREALDAAIPRLRDMLEASGIELVDVDVSGQSFARQEAGSDPQPTLSAAVGSDEGEETVFVRETPVSALVANGRLDLFV